MCIYRGFDLKELAENKVPNENLEEKERLSVLVVEDDAEVRCLLEREIADHGHPVVAVGTGEKAFEILKESAFAVVITDIRMPGMDGVELTRRIKDVRPETEVILITGYASVDSASRALRLGAADYLTKPFGDLERINESLSRALERYRERQAARRRLLELEAHRGTLEHVLDRLPMGVLLIDGRGTVLMSNRAATTILRQQDGLSVSDDGQLQLTSPTAGELKQLIDRATGIKAGAGRRVGGAVMLERPSGSSPYSALVTPLGDVHDGIDPDRHAAALFVSDPSCRLETAEELLRRLYGLTRSEARIAAILMQGRSVEDAAGDLEVSTNTIRTHLKRVFSKTGTLRQGDLISLLLSGPALLRLEHEPE